ncbi:TPA: tRNA (adenosine(37)-N6)-threonylcarbamoyltransferase complex ATPase subunit type 1 TsaE [Streptococcus suis]|uniref:tRNA threonylcarbamoyladenosine biosynthesis protein TsaE n=1 Tax=Streptococcus suivaginalis TaxID=3028082 RepID=A0AA96VFX1_9STRE|nr:tRNA (adenosine(37)-N6)-threonylcarbamoyltransferase complex ATPase subunit type 1 TsaE [Streptococcus sp. 29896]MBM7315057.1 tRNA (adenosine(37)-N6)-threonylcarbamoyltransferase complex ATPase subunit type 1 TsaE [Streptococcus suis]MCK4026880.1 tRNA (adenosine(37)-N6)-threonylcarbamoyltransferase complex ATPase subunit type 1 TsaE [Streptococcus suis]WNY47468.1 tRNA (adenosine(37)-N6)-threonylcarbamoyltransferase complex ATPase subunit type 1 TsaE [Streptococcus sp. 29896]HEL1587296.1 tRNA
MYSQNEATLVAIGEKLGRVLQPNQVLVLSGELGAGKTTFTKGLALGLDIKQMIKSPTYTIVREYEGRLPLYHLDVYRIGDDPDSIDLDDFLYGNGVTVIEWGDLLDSSLLDDYLFIRIEKEGNGRRLTFQPHGPKSERLAEAVQYD